jgi:hypothetical protein
VQVSGAIVKQAGLSPVFPLPPGRRRTYL